MLWQSAACKPGSVENGHLSRREVANALKRYCGNRTGRPISSLHLAPDGVYRTAQSPGRRCALTAPFHPYRGLPRRYLSVALALESPPPAVSRHPALRCPDFPHAPRGTRGHSAAFATKELYRGILISSIIRGILIRMYNYTMISSRPQVSHSTWSPAFTLRETEEGSDIWHPPH